MAPMRHATRETALTYILRMEGDDTELLNGGSTLASASRDGTIRRWGLRGSAPEMEVMHLGHTDWVNDLATLPNGMLASASNDATIRVWSEKPSTSSGDSGTDTCVGVLSGHSDYAMALAYAPSKGLLASAGLGSQLFLWDLKGGGKSVQVTGLSKVDSAEVTGAKDSLYCVAMDESGTLVAAGGPEQVVRLWDTRSSTKVCKFRGHTENIRAICIDAAGKTCVSGSSDATVRVWDVGMQRLRSTFESHADSVWALAMDKAERVVYSGSRDKSVFAHDMTTGTSSPLFVETHAVLCLEPDGQGNAIWTGTSASSIHKWFASLPSTDRQASGRRRSSKSHVMGSSPPISSRGLSPLHADLKSSERVLNVAQTVTPAVTIPGTPAITRYRLTKNRRDVLTMNSEGVIEKVDITSGLRVAVPEFQKGTNFEEAEKVDDETKLFVPSWCTLDARRGRLAVKLQLKSCFGADIYAGEVAGNSILDERKINIGEHILCALLLDWNTKADALESDAPRVRGGVGTQTKAKAADVEGEDDHEGGGRAEVAAARTMFQFDHAPLLQSEDEDGRTWLRRSCDFSGREDGSVLPPWVIDCVRDKSMPPREKVKYGFYLEPHETSSLPKFSSGKLNAPRIFRVHKVIAYVVKGLELDKEQEDEREDEGTGDSNAAAADSSSDAASPRGASDDGAPSSRASPTATALSQLPCDHNIEILCNGEVLPKMMSLATIKHHIWRKSSDIMLFYRTRETPEGGAIKDGADASSANQVGRIARKAFSPLGC